MRHLFNAVMNSNKKAAVPFLNPFKWNRASQLCLAILTIIFQLPSCTKQDSAQPSIAKQAMSCASTSAKADLSTPSFKTLEELKEAREATIRYKDINNAFADGYIDIHVVMENMGYHFEKPSLADSVFDIKHPELLVYNKNADGSFKLVAIEYAVPLDKSADAPKGFTGKQDVWDHNTGFGLWLLHAWVYEFNPDGVFNPTNPRVHVTM
jgi:hypothetical protein